MLDVPEFLKSITIVLTVAAVTTVVFQRLHQPVVLGYLIAGLIVGPHVPVPIVADEAIVETLSQLGVILLMYSLGLEFSLGKLVKVGPMAATTAVIQSGLMAWLGFLTGRLFGWTVMESVFTGAVIAISSTTIIAKVFDERRIGGSLKHLVVGVLLIEDLIAVVFMAALTAAASGAGLSAGALAATIGRLALWLAALVAIGMVVLRPFIHFVVRLGRAETTLVANIGVCFGMAYLALAFGYSVALGAFIAGSMVAESGHGELIERLVSPVRDMFAAIFFVSVGMLLDPAQVGRHWGAVLALTSVVIVGKVTSVALGAFLAGSGARTAIQAGMSLAQIGEFSFIIAGLGRSLGATGEFLYPVVVSVAGLTTLTTPWLIRAAAPVAAVVDRKLPRRLQTFATLYGAWLERLRPSPQRSAGVWRLIRLLLVDAAVLAGVIVGAALGLERGADTLARVTGASLAVARVLMVALAVALAVPLVLGIGRLSYRLGSTLAARAFPRTGARVDLDRVPRQALGVTLRVSAALITGVVVLAVIQPFVPGYVGLAALAALFVGFTVAIWHRAEDLDSHVRAGAQAVVEALTAYARRTGPAPTGSPFTEIRDLLPGLGTPVVVTLPPGSPAVGKSLAELDLRGRTGATVLAVSHQGVSVPVPAATERLQAGDVIAVAGTREAIEAARAVLLGPAAAG
ncbi:MAG: cation:proton antiporter [Gemmatimonadetes bacterium]|nr:cation:proton antiporter [Gemmatimonadota bacterium]